MLAEEEQALPVDDEGRPELWLAPLNGQLVLAAASGKYVDINSVRLYRRGIFQFRIRGSAYNKRTNRSTDTTAGTELVLCREPDNEHDPNAVSIRSAQGRHLGYVNKLNAKRIARLLDGGEGLVAVSMLGSPARRDGGVVRVLVVPPDLLKYLLRDGGRPLGWKNTCARPTWVYAEGSSYARDLRTAGTPPVHGIVQHDGVEVEIARIRIGDRLQVRLETDRWSVTTENGVDLGGLRWPLGKPDEYPCAGTLRVTKVCLVGDTVIDIGGHVVPDRMPSGTA